MTAITCPTCNHNGRVPNNVLGMKISCKKCGDRFTAGEMEMSQQAFNIEEPRELAPPVKTSRKLRKNRIPYPIATALAILLGISLTTYLITTVISRERSHSLKAKIEDMRSQFEADEFKASNEQFKALQDYDAKALSRRENRKASQEQHAKTLGFLENDKFESEMKKKNYEIEKIENIEKINYKLELETKNYERLQAKKIENDEMVKNLIDDPKGKLNSIFLFLSFLTACSSFLTLPIVLGYTLGGNRHMGSSTGCLICLFTSWLGVLLLVMTPRN